MTNLLTVDVEDYFHVSGMTDVVPFEKWDDFESRVERNLEILFEVLEETKATFFILGWVAKKSPSLIRRIDELGHEVASHGQNHRLVTSMTQEEFRKDLNESVKLIEDLIGKPVLGYRAPSCSITRETSWAFEVIASLGLKYDSSVFPVKRRRGGIPGAEMKPYTIDTPEGSIMEFPLAVWNLLGKKMPVGGGGFLRFYPYWLTRKSMKKLNSKEHPVVVYVHPWEIDTEQPRLKSILTRDGFNHYYGQKTTLMKIKKILADFEFFPIKDYLNQQEEN